MPTVPGPLLALDVGTLTVGVATCDPTRTVVRPIRTLNRSGVARDASAIAAIAAEEGVTGVVVGLPLGLDGNETRSTRLARQVGEAVSIRTGLPVTFWDERFSSVEAGRRLLETGRSAKHRKARIDQAAACVILQDFLESAEGLAFAAAPPSA